MAPLMKLTSGVKKQKNVCKSRIFYCHHVLCEVLRQAEKATLRIEPGVSPELLVVGLKAFDDARDAELVVPLGAVERPDDEVDDTEMEALLVWVLRRDPSRM